MHTILVTLIYGNKMHEVWKDVLYLYFGKYMIYQHGKDKYLWFNPLIMDFMNLLDYLENYKDVLF